MQTYTLTVSREELDTLFAALWATNRSGGRHPNFDLLEVLADQTGVDHHEFLTHENITRISDLLDKTDFLGER